VLREPADGIVTQIINDWLAANKTLNTIIFKFHPLSQASIIQTVYAAKVGFA
jgi:hypothetical protein